MNNVSWTPEEDLKLLTMDRKEFLREHPHRSADGARFRLAKLNKEKPEGPIVLAPDDGEAEDVDLSEDAYDRYFAAIEEAVEIEKELSSSVDLATYTFPDDEPIAIFFTSDWHIGAGGVEYARLREDLELAARTPGLYGVFNGDGIENTKTHTKSATALYSAAIPKPKHQLELLRRMASILKPRVGSPIGLSGSPTRVYQPDKGAEPRANTFHGGWLAFAEGNHDAFDYRAAGVDRIGVLCEELDVPYFREKGGTLKVSVGGQDYNIFVKHQYAGSSKINKSNRARRMHQEWPWDADNGDVLALAHLHEPDLHITMQRGLDTHWLQSGTYKTSDAWAESNGYHPSYGVPVVILFPGERRILSFHGSKFREAVDIFSNIRENWTMGSRRVGEAA